MRLEYIGSAGTIDLTQFETAIYKANFHAYEWGYSGTEQALGVTVDQFTKQPLTYEMTVAVRGSESAKKEALNNILEITEQDVINMTPGKLYWNEHYLECYIIASETSPAEDFHGAERTMTIFAPYPFWIKEVSKEFYKVTVEEEEQDYLDYPYDYDYDYQLQSAGQSRWNVDHYAASEFVMTLFGYCQNPRVLIGDYPYQIFDTCEDGEYITIDSRNRTVTKTLNNGSTVNIFDLRAKDNSVFEKIPGGNLLVTWPGTFGITIKLFTERSEPKW